MRFGITGLMDWSTPSALCVPTGMERTHLREQLELLLADRVPIRVQTTWDHGVPLLILAFDGTTPDALWERYAWGRVTPRNGAPWIVHGVGHCPVRRELILAPVQDPVDRMVFQTWTGGRASNPLVSLMFGFRGLFPFRDIPLLMQH